MVTLSPSRFIIALFVLAFLTGCGRAGSPYTPSQAAAKQAKENNQPAPPAPEKRDRRFILDGLLN